MSYPKDELPAPPAALADTTAFELARLWFAGGAPRVSARVELWPDPAAWGLVLGDAARQLAAAYAERGDDDPAVVLARIRAGLLTELDEA